MKTSKEYIQMSIPQRLVVPKELIGKLTDILVQCAAQEYVYRSGQAHSLYFARPLSFDLATEIEIDEAVYSLKPTQFRAYCEAIKDTTGDDIMGAEEWLNLTK
jgi:hypothetical protein